MTTIDRRTFIKGAALTGAAALTMNQRLWAADDFDPIRKEIATRHDEALKRLRNGKTSIVIDVGTEPIKYIYDPTRPDSVHAKYWVDSILELENAKPRTHASRRGKPYTQKMAIGSRKNSRKRARTSCLKA